MTFSSPQSTSSTKSPRSPTEHELRFRLRNSEDAHNDLLAAAQLEHRRVRHAAVRAFQLNEERLAQLKISEEASQAEERVRIKTQRALDEQRLRKAQEKAEKIPVAASVRVEPTTPLRADQGRAPIQISTFEHNIPDKENAPIHHAPPLQAPNSVRSENHNVESTATALRSSTSTFPPPRPSPLPAVSVQNAAPTRSPNSAEGQSLARPSIASATKATGTVPTQSTLSHLLPHVDRYSQIHRTLKELRRFVSPTSPTDEKARQLKKKAGEIRRTIKSSIGQLTGEKGANRVPLNKIKDVLREARDTFPSPPVDPSTVLVSTPPQQNGVPNNSDALPSLFIYALNMLGKGIIAQFLNEAAVAPETADPIGIIAVSVFAQNEFSWRGQTLITILMAKFRVICPVLFGIRGSEKTREGRLRLGWQQLTDDAGKPTDGWISEQEHNARMTGMGAGYASIALRDFSKASMKNPWPPTNYWHSMASITSTPPDQMSSTQIIVLKAMIENYEQRFLNSFGSCAKAALKVAIVDFPARSNERNAAVSSLQVLADKLRRDTGLDLER